MLYFEKCPTGYTFSARVNGAELYLPSERLHEKIDISADLGDCQLGYKHQLGSSIQLNCLKYVSYSLDIHYQHYTNCKIKRKMVRNTSC